MERDVRNTPLYREADSLWRAFRQPGKGLVSDCADISTNGIHVIFAGTMADAIDGSLPTRICSTDLATGDTRVLTFGPGIDRLPKFSPDGGSIAFLSDRHQPGDFQLYLLDRVSGAANLAVRVDGWVEYFHWSADNTRILLAVAGHGADTAGGQGAIASEQTPECLPPWMPAVENGDESFRWRTAWIYDLATGGVQRIPVEGLNLWEVVWCGRDSIGAIASSSPGEGSWYSAQLYLVDTRTGCAHVVYEPREQLGWVVASASGRKVAFVEAVCSDRWIVAGDLLLLDVATRQVRRVSTLGVDITSTEWRSESRLLLAGHRGFETTVGLYDADSDVYLDIWCSANLTVGGRYATVSGYADNGNCVLVGESFRQAPEIAVIEQGEYRRIRSLDVGYAELSSIVDSVEQVVWTAPDGLEIQGWLLRPNGKAPHATVMNIHGGPVWHWRPWWLGRTGLHTLMLVKGGYAVFLPNPRGSAGRGQDFALRVKGDLNGADTQDLLSGLDHLVLNGVADPRRLGVMGGSYGGNMTCWLITQDTRFAAAVSLAPHVNQVTEHLLSNIPNFISLFLQDTYTNLGGKYFQRSPVLHAHKVKTPTLSVCGALDRCTPPEEALQFHNALLENCGGSVLVVYPHEGHGIRKYPAIVDYAARVSAWFGEFMPSVD